MADSELESSDNIHCKVRIPLDGDVSRTVEYREKDPYKVDLSIHQWCSSHNINNVNNCNILRNYFLDLCHPTYLDDFHGPVYPVTLRDKTFNVQMKKEDAHINVSIDRLCAQLLLNDDHSSAECFHIKSAFLSDESFLASTSLTPAALLQTMFEAALSQNSDVRDHVADHARLAEECEVVLELGVRDMVSTWGMLRGLSRNGMPVKKYIGVDLLHPPGPTFKRFQIACKEAGIDCVFLAQNDMTLAGSPVLQGGVDLMFVDALHTYSHVLYELTTFHRGVRRYIALHDTSPPWGYVDEPYSGDYSEYPAWFDRSKRGVFTAVEDFLAMHRSEWAIRLRKENSYGYTLLERVGPPAEV